MKDLEHLLLNTGIVLGGLRRILAVEPGRKKGGGGGGGEGEGSGGSSSENRHGAARTWANSDGQAWKIERRRRRRRGRRRNRSIFC